MGELWQELVELLRQRPLLWVPVLVADLLGFLCNLGKNAAVQAFITHQSMQHSALGGAPVRGPLSNSAFASAAVAALLFTWFSYFLRVLLYAVALVATAAMVQRSRKRGRDDDARKPLALAQHSSGILELALRALAVYAVAALFLGWLSPWLAQHGQAVLLHSFWFSNGLMLIVLMILAYSLPPAALRVLSGTQPEVALANLGRQLAMVLLLLVAVLGLFVSGGHQLQQAKPAIRIPLEMVASLVLSLPYVLLFVGLGVLARTMISRQGAEVESV